MYRVQALSLGIPSAKRSCNMLQPVTTLDRQVTLRSVDNNDLFIFRSRHRFGENAFRILTPRAWNSLPSDVKKAV